MSHSRQLKADLLLTAPAHGEPTLCFWNRLVDALMEVMAETDSRQQQKKSWRGGARQGQEEKS